METTRKVRGGVTMRIVTWNMGCGPKSKYRSTHSQAWSYLVHELKPDVALVQEALFLAETPDLGGCLLWSEKRGPDSGSAVFLADCVQHERGVVCVEGSYIASALVTFECLNTEIVSIHVGPGNYRKHLVAVRDWLRERVVVSPTLIVGGDLNSSRQLDDWHRAYLDGLSEIGLHDCHWALHGSESHSFWGHQAAHLTLQDDHIFVSSSLASVVSSCRVVKNDTSIALSDHGPLVLELDLRKQSSR